MTIWIFIAATAFTLVFRYLDWFTSVNFINYIGREKTKIFRDKYGFASRWKVWAVTAAFLGTGLVLSLTVHPLAGPSWNASLGIFSIFQWRSNASSNAADRRLQNAELDKLLLLSEITPATVGKIPGPFSQNKDRYYFGHFQFIYSTDPDLDAAWRNVIQRLIALAKDRSLFPKDKIF